MPLRLLKATAYSTIFVLSGALVAKYFGIAGWSFSVLAPGIEVLRLFRKPGPGLPHALLIVSTISIAFYAAVGYIVWMVVADPVMPASNKAATTKQPKRPTVRIRAGLRLLYATIGIIAGNALLLMFCLSVQNGGWDIFALYAIFGSIPGWILVGIPVALMFPARLLMGTRWRIISLVIGAALGPLAVFLIFLVLGIANRQFSLAYTGQYFGLSIPVSTVSFMVFATLLRRLARELLARQCI